MDYRIALCGLHCISPTSIKRVLFELSRFIITWGLNRLSEGFYRIRGVSVETFMGSRESHLETNFELKESLGSIKRTQQIFWE